MRKLTFDKLQEIEQANLLLLLPKQTISYLRQQRTKGVSKQEMG